MDIIPYKQSLTHSCLVTCFLMILKAQERVDFTESDEQEIALNGSRRIYQSYMAGISNEIAKKYAKNINIYTDNKFFTKVLQNSFKDKRIQVSHEPITLAFIKTLLGQRLLICHIDNNSLVTYSHSSPFIVLEKPTNNIITIIV